MKTVKHTSPADHEVILMANDSCCKADCCPKDKFQPNKKVESNVLPILLTRI